MHFSQYYCCNCYWGKTSTLQNWGPLMFSAARFISFAVFAWGSLEWNKCPQLCPARLLECVNKEFVWEFRRGFVFFSKGKDLNLEGKLSSVKFGLYIPFSSLLFKKMCRLCLPEALRSWNMHLKVSFHFCFYRFEAFYETFAANFNF